MAGTSKSGVKFHPKDYLSLGFVVAVSLGMLGVTAMSVQEALRAYGQIQESKEEIQKVNERLEKLEGISQGSLEPMREAAYQALPKEKPVIEILDTMEALTAEKGISLVELESRPGSVATASAATSLKNQSAAAAKTKQGAQQVTVTFTLKGRFTAINDFILSLSRAIPLFDVNEVRLLPRGSTEQEDEIRAEMDVVYYWMPEKSVSIGNDIRAYEVTESDVEIIEKLKTYRDYTALPPPAEVQ